MLYCDYADKEIQSARNVLGALLGQFLHKHPEIQIPEGILKEYEDNNRTVNLKDILREFKNVASSVTSNHTQKKWYICLDAIDELAHQDDRGRHNDVLDFLETLLQVNQSLRILITGRPSWMN